MTWNTEPMPPSIEDYLTVKFHIRQSDTMDGWVYRYKCEGGGYRELSIRNDLSAEENRQRAIKFFVALDLEEIFEI